MKKLLVFSLFIPMLAQAYNAGVLPYTKKGGRIQILLSQEAHGRHKGQFADNGGKGKPGESIEETAIREFTEETGAIFARFMNQRVTSKKDAKRLSNKYIKSRLKAGLPNPGPKVFYTMYLAEVDYLNPKEILEDPYDLFDHEKNDFEWVDAQDFLATLQRNNRYLQQYYDGDKKSYNPSFGDKQIRRPFATYFADPVTNERIRSIIGLPASQPVRASQQSQKIKENEMVLQRLLQTLKRKLKSLNTLLEEYTTY